MRTRAAVVMVLLMGVLGGLLLSGVLNSPAPSLAADERGAAALEQTVATAALAVPQESGQLKELRDFAGKFEMLFQTVADQVSPAVVLIESARTVRMRTPGFQFRSPFDDMFEDFFRQPFGPRGPMVPQTPPRERESKMTALGSGCILDEKGHVLTNNHMVAGAEELKVKLTDGRTFEAKLVGADEKTDLAVIRIEEEAKDLPTVKLGDSDGAKVGQWVIAIGNPFGLRHTVSAGIISATGRSGLGVAEYESMIQTDAAINRGNSGGPLVNLNCEVIGINTAIVGPGGNIGIGFAIPINMAKDILEDLKAGREVVRGYLGVYLADMTPEMAESFGYRREGGVLVHEVARDSAADKAGIQAGDVIVEYDGRKVENASDLRRRVAATGPGKRVEVKIWRDGTEKAVAVEVANLAEASATAEDWLGLRVQTLTKELAEGMGKAGLEGVLVSEVRENSVAAEYVSAGDVILSVNRAKVRTAEEYAERMSNVGAGERVLLHVLDGQSGRQHFLTIRRPRGEQ